MVTVGNRAGGALAAMEIDSPDGWFVKESFTLLAPDGQSNVIFSSEPLDLTLSTGDYAAVQGQLLANEFPAYRELRFEPFALRGEGVAMLRVFEWRPPDGVAVTQGQLYYVRDGRGYTSTATTPSTNFERVWAQLQGILSSISVRGSTAAAV